ncbi:hypothetical protein F9K91_07970 [Brucella tritici]|uniref:Uncharacterized protein n=2 Tax=Brucella/Ochrobactrum group TaxID=2826938 RepID=A0A833CN93_9HYPH|nr:MULTISPECIES: hypothetical protein [Brucella]KAB2666058.1 hypothetical protein F9K91_07970 [Brucella tritici]MCH4539129.1 hypothetical protein [Ochrobactrum sp. A-1]SPL65409.1 hypothetical protein OHAE_1276 [[Ochrobactrum] soli]
MKIKIIAGAEPHREGEYPWSYMVGCDGVTEIVEEDQNLGTYGITWFVVKSGDAVIAKMNALYVANITLFPVEGGAK